MSRWNVSPRPFKPRFFTALGDGGVIVGFGVRPPTNIECGSCGDKCQIGGDVLFSVSPPKRLGYWLYYMTHA